ncbi:MAG: TAXI family TRAP transporter solute-binding subunit [Tissierellales bacterium]|nr:TAXI family TRAP transporter solute-binding subunit [Tissierellales bacterium]
MKLKKLLILLLVLALLAGTTACYREPAQGAESTANTDTTSTPPAGIEDSPLDVSMLGGSPGSVWDLIANGISGCIMESYPGSIIQITPGSSNANVIRLNQDEVDFALVHNTLSFSAANGMDPFDEKAENLRAVAQLYSSVFQMVVTSEMGVSRFEEIIEQQLKIRLSIGNPGSAAEGAFLRILDAYGLTVQEMENWGAVIMMKSQSDASSMLSDGLIDGMVLLTLAPAPQIVETAINKDLVLLELNPEKIKQLCDAYGYQPCTIPSEAYSFLSKETASFSDVTYLAASVNTPNQNVTKVLQALHENLDYFKSVHASLHQLMPENMPKGSALPMHPGALSYYQDVGLIAQKVSFDESPINISVLGGSPSGVFFMIVNGISECINKTYPGSIVQIMPGGVVTNPIQVNAGTVDTGMSHNIFTFAATNGMSPYEAPLSELRTIASFYDSCLQMVLTEDMGVKSFDEIIENKVKIRLSIDKPDSSGAAAFNRMIAEYDMTIADMEAWGCQILNKNFEDSVSMLGDGSIDGFCISTLAPAPPIVESSINKKLTIIEMNPQKIKSLCDRYGYTEVVIPAGTYEFHDRDFIVPAATTVLTISANASDETAYKIAKSIHQNLDYMQSVHSALQQMSPESMVQKLGAPLHPGAEMYYREAGLLSD